MQLDELAQSQKSRDRGVVLPLLRSGRVLLQAPDLALPVCKLVTDHIAQPLAGADGRRIGSINVVVVVVVVVHGDLGLLGRWRAALLHRPGGREGFEVELGSAALGAGVRLGRLGPRPRLRLRLLLPLGIALPL